MVGHGGDGVCFFLNYFQGLCAPCFLSGTWDYY